MVVVWADGRTSSNARIYYSRSTDNGATWSAAAQLAPPGVANTYQVEPWVRPTRPGTFHAIWYDDRENPNTSIFNIYYSQSTDDGATWSTAVRISTATTDLRIGIPSSYARAAGDYINVTASHGNVYGVWTDTRSGTGEDVYVVRGTSAARPRRPSPAPRPRPRDTRTPTLTPTATQTPCTTGAVVNGGFESGSLAPWTVLDTHPTPVVSNAQAHSGTYSALVGTVQAASLTGTGQCTRPLPYPHRAVPSHTGGTAAPPTASHSTGKMPTSPTRAATSWLLSSIPVTTTGRLAQPDVRHGRVRRTDGAHRVPGTPGRLW